MWWGLTIGRIYWGFLSGVYNDGICNGDLLSALYVIDTLGYVPFLGNCSDIKIMEDCSLNYLFYSVGNSTILTD